MKNNYPMAIAILIIIFCVLGLPFTSWGFKTDDWGNIYHAIINQWQDFINFFTEGNSEKVYHPCNIPPGEEAFFQGLYRPMSFVYYFIQYCVFGINPYGFFLVSIALHAANAALLFLIFSRFIAHIKLAWCTALFFGFHPSLWNWIGWTSAQTYFIELFIFLTIMCVLYIYLQTKQYRYYLLACILYLLNIFLKEQTIFFPAWIVVAAYFYCHKNMARALRFSSGFWLIAGMYLITRLRFFPLTAATGTLTFEPTWHSFITRMSSRFYDFVTYISDVCALSALPIGHPYLKGTFIILMLGYASMLFFYNKRKGFILFCIASMLLFSWPALLMHYQPRYIYLALPWSSLIFLLLVTGCKKPVLGEIIRTPYCSTRSIHRFLILPILIHACFLYYHLGQREEVLRIISSAFYQLAHNPVTNNRTLCFLALPPRWFHEGSAQAVWMLKGNNTQKIYQFNTPIAPIDGNLPDNYLKFEHHQNLVRCISTNPHMLWFMREDGSKTTTAIIPINETYLADNPLFIAWDYKAKQLKILPHLTLNTRQKQYSENALFCYTSSPTQIGDPNLDSRFPPSLKLRRTGRGNDVAALRSEQ